MGGMAEGIESVMCGPGSFVLQNACMMVGVTLRQSITACGSEKNHGESNLRAADILLDFESTESTFRGREQKLY